MLLSTWLRVAFAFAGAWPAATGGVAVTSPETVPASLGRAPCPGPTPDTAMTGNGRRAEIDVGLRAANANASAPPGWAVACEDLAAALVVGVSPPPSSE